jgi:hypothetical protein
MTSTLTAVGNELPPHASAGSGNQVPGPDGTGHRAQPAHTGQAGQPALAGPRHRVSPTVLNLIETARRGLAEAEGQGDPGTRYICAHLAALRAAAAIVAARGEPGAGGRRRRPRSVWELLPQVEPTLGEWAAFFAASAAKRAAAEAGLPRAATAREAEDLLRDAATFVSVAERALGIDSQLLLPLKSAS